MRVVLTVANQLPLLVLNTLRRMSVALTPPTDGEVRHAVIQHILVQMPPITADFLEHHLDIRGSHPLLKEIVVVDIQRRRPSL